VPEMDREEEIVRLLAVQVRLAVPNQTQAILELGRAGFGPARIGELLGTSAATAKTTIHRARKKGSNADG
jgi:DNA-directed RNA polymerase specialized sigma24 family protein